MASTAAPSPSRTHLATALPARLAGALLALAVVVIHVIDQGGFPGQKDPAYVGIGYYLIEAVGVVVAVGLLAARTDALARLLWVGAAGVALGPLAGYVASRGPGLPDYDDDKGAWGEPLGVVSIVVEVALLALAVAALTRGDRSRR